MGAAHSSTAASHPFTDAKTHLLSVPLLLPDGERLNLFWSGGRTSLYGSDAAVYGSDAAVYGCNAAAILF
eukprot:198704-Rhodomonas_salina.1